MPSSHILCIPFNIQALLPNVVEHTNATLADLMSDTVQKSYKKRAIGKLTFQLGPDVKFGVELHNLVRPATAPKKIKLDRRTSEPLKAVTTKFNVVIIANPRFNLDFI